MAALFSRLSFRQKVPTRRKCQPAARQPSWAVHSEAATGPEMRTALQVRLLAMPGRLLLAIARSLRLFQAVDSLGKTPNGVAQQSYFAQKLCFGWVHWPPDRETFSGTIESYCIYSEKCAFSPVPVFRTLSFAATAWPCAT